MRVNKLQTHLALISTVGSPNVHTHRGCGGSATGAIPPPPANTNTQVVLLLTSTANDGLVEFNTNISSITLSSATGNPVVIYTNSKPRKSPASSGSI